MIDIRPAESKDLKTIYDIESRVFDHPWNLAQIETEFKRKNITVFDVIAIEGQVIGYLIANVIGKDVQIINVAIAPKWQHKGYGKKLVENFLARYIDSSIITLEVKRSNFNAINLYLELGFCEVGRRSGYYQDNEEAILMAIGLDEEDD